ncbi:MAG: NAD-dependent deacetylase [Magnetococcales bacterium]|nr:NAD-dependent deacetylase [Magnetococcales bacterium]
MTRDNHQDNWYKAAGLLAEAEALMITAGAGMGVDSGLPDFRGNDGFWRAYPPMKKLGLTFMEMANPQGFIVNPSLAWGFYGHRLNLYRRTIPHEGYRLLKQWGEVKPLGYFVFTSNVDGQFQKAGLDPECIEECHGTIHQLQCIRPCSDALWDADPVTVEVDETRFLAQPPLPACIHCQGLARPNILMFGDGCWNDAHARRQGQRRHRWLEAVRSRKAKLVIIELGAGLAVPTVRQFSQAVARLPETHLLRINPRDVGIGADNHLALPSGALEGLLRLNSCAATSIGMP